MRTVHDVAKCIIQTLGRGSIEISESRNEQHEANLLQLIDKARQKLGWQPRWGVEKHFQRQQSGIKHIWLVVIWKIFQELNCKNFFRVVMIEGVILTPLKQIFDERGKVMHMLRKDSPYFQNLVRFIFHVLILAQSKLGIFIKK